MVAEESPRIRFVPIRNDLLGRPGFLADPPAQIDRLEHRALGLAVVPQLGKHPRLQNFPLGLHVAEGGTDKEAEGGGGHGGAMRGLMVKSYWLLVIGGRVGR
jgi:hypothetical protein